jgi:hypothetical protein
MTLASYLNFLKIIAYLPSGARQHRHIGFIHELLQAAGQVDLCANQIFNIYLAQAR